MINHPTSTFIGRARVSRGLARLKGGDLEQALEVAAAEDLVLKADPQKCKGWSGHLYKTMARCVAVTIQHATCMDQSLLAPWLGLLSVLGTCAVFEWLHLVAGVDRSGRRDLSKSLWPGSFIIGLQRKMRRE